MITTTMLTGLFRQPCGRCHVVHTLGRCQECSAPLCLNCANQGKGGRLVCLDCHVLYVRERAAIQDNLVSFFQETSAYVNKHVLDPHDMIIRGVCGHSYFVRLTPDMGVAQIIDLSSQLCPECVRDMIEFEKTAEAEYQLQQAWDELQSVPAYVLQWQRYHDGLSAFFRAVAMIASQEVDPFSLNNETVQVWHEANSAYMEWEQTRA